RPGRPMTGRVTPLGFAVLAVAGCALSLAVLSARPELFVAALPLLLALVPLALRAPALDHRIAHEVSRGRVLEGESVTVTVTVQARASIALLELLGPLPAGSVVVSGRHRAAMALRAGQTGRWSYEVRFEGRGAHDMGTIAVRVRDRFGIRAWEQRHVDPKPVRVYPHIALLRSLPRPAHARASVGDYVSSVLGEGIEPGDIRQFAPGDRIKQVNWRASLRLGKLYVTQHQRERNADVVLMLDTLAEGGRARDTRATLDLAARGFDLVVLVVSPVEVTRRALAPSPTIDLACRLWTLDRRARLAELHRQGVAVLEWSPPEPLELALAGARRARP